jgi:hypothetical protein
MRQPELDKKYQEIIKTCKFIAKPNTWFVEGLEVKCVDTCSYAPYKNQDTFNAGWGLFEGWTNETFIGFDGELPREDGETCQFDEFYIYDKFGNEISEITLSEYELLSINNGTPTPNINGDSKTGKLKKVNGNWVVEAILADSDSSEYYCIPLYELKVAFEKTVAKQDKNRKFRLVRVDIIQSTKVIS